MDVDITYSGVRPGEKLYEWDALRIQLRALVPDFHVPPPPPTEDSEQRPAAISGERKLHLA